MFDIQHIIYPTMNCLFVQVSYKKCFVILIFFFFFCNTRAQNMQQVDSLQNLYNASKHDTTKINALLGLMQLYRATNPSIALPKGIEAMALAAKSNNEFYIAETQNFYAAALLYVKKYDSTIFYASKALKIFEKIKRTLGIINAVNNIGVAYKAQKIYNKALENYMIGYTLANQLPADKKYRTLARAASNISEIYRFKTNYPSCLQYALEAVKYAELSDKNENVCLAYNSIISIYITINDLPNAIVYANKLLKISAELQLKKYSLTALKHLGNIFFDINDDKASELGIAKGKRLSTAFNYQQQAVAIANTIEDKSVLSSIYNDIGYMYITLKDYKNAQQFYEKTLTIDSTLQDDYSIANDKVSLGEIYCQNGDIAKAENFVLLGLAIATSQQSLDLVQESHRVLQMIYEKKGNVAKAYFHFKAFTQLKDSLNSIENNKAIAQQQIQFEYDKKAVADSVFFANEKTIANATLSKEKNTKIFFAIIAVILLVGGGFLYRQFAIKKNLSKALAQTNELKTKQNNTLKELNHSLILSEENLQNANTTKEQLIAMMSHDLLNPITAITNYQNILEKDIDKLTEAEIKDAFFKIGNSIKPMHGLLGSMLYWVMLQKNNIQTKIDLVLVHKIINEANDLYKIPASMRNIAIHNNLDAALSPIHTDENMLRFIIRNVLNNAIKFSPNNGQIQINFSQNNIAQIITIQDNGTGIQPEVLAQLNNTKTITHSSKETGLGLAVSKEFARLLNVSIEFLNNKNGGSTVIISLPIAA